jgi:deoxycytidylate deaminase
MKDIHKNDNEIMLHAANIAIKSDMRSKHGCVIVDKKGNIISAAHNSAINITDKSTLDKTYKKGNKISRHAEENALRMVDPKKLDGAKLYVVRSGIKPNNPLFMNSKPCARCTAIINACMKKFGLKVVYYSSE